MIAKEEIKLESFKYFKPLEIRWNDLDPIGHVNNVFYIEYFQIGRGTYMTEMSESWDWTKHMFVIANISCNYYKEINLSSKNVRLGVRVTSIGTKSFELQYVIISDRHDEKPIIHAMGTSTQVLIDLSIKKSIEIPVWLRTDIIEYEPAL